MELVFFPISLDRQREYRELLALCPVKPSDYSLLNLWAWAGEYGLEWAWDGELVWIRQTRPRRVYWAPVGPWDQVDWERSLETCSREQTVFIRIPQPLLDIWLSAAHHFVKWEDAREQWDYLYASEELIHLRGKQFHKKKNLLNRFRKLYPYEYTVFDGTMIKQAMAMQQDWCTWRDCESSETLAAENRVIYRVLKNWNDLPPGILGGALLVDGQMVAYTIGEKVAADTVVIHFEKGDPEFKGANQAINQMFLEKSGIDVPFVNREQDLGDQGLRRAKLSYNPVAFLKKYTVFLK